MDTQPASTASSAPAQDHHDYRYRFGSAEFDESTFVLSVDGQPVDVERRALEVLAYLLRCAGEVVTKEELFSEVWAGRLTVDKVLPNAINKLRRALGPVNAELLVTQPRLGYRLTGLTERIVIRSRTPSPLNLVADGPAPSRPHYLLRQSLGGKRGSEVWLAEHVSTGVRHVYKYASTAGRLRSLKREATLARVLASQVPEGERDHFVRLIDWHFESEPFFLEYENGGDNLLEWSHLHLAPLSNDARLALFLQIADAVAVAHQVGVLHKDIKPANVLITASRGDWHVRLTDFGSGGLMDPEQLEVLGITHDDLSATRDLGSASSSGTPMYLAPEVIAGQLQTVQSDVYALGLILYQLLAGDLARPMASGWEKDIDDSLLCEDIAAATDGNPAHRLASVTELSQRLRRLTERRNEAEQARQMELQADAARQALAKARARRPFVGASLVILAVGLLVSLWFYRDARIARDKAQSALDQAEALNTFVTEDVIGRSNPLIMANGSNASVKDVLLAARERVDGRFKSQPLVAASIHSSLGTLFNSIELLPEARDQFAAVLETYERETGANSLETVKARSTLVRVLTRTSEFDAARKQLDLLDAQTKDSKDPERQYQRELARGTFFANIGQFDQAIPAFETSIQLADRLHPDDIPMHDSLRFDLIQIYTQTGKQEQARILGESLLKETRSREPRNALAIAVAGQVLAGTYIKLKRLDEAERLLLDARKTVTSLTGAGSMRSMMLLNNLLDISLQREQWLQALQQAEELHTGIARQLGPDSILSVATLGALGQVQFLAGDSARASTNLTQAYQQLSKAYGPENPQTQVIGFWQAADALALEQWELAERTMGTLEAKQLDAAAASPSWQLKLDLLRGLLLHGRHQDAQALPLLRTAVAGLRKQVDTERRLLDMGEAALRESGAS